MVGDLNCDLLVSSSKSRTLNNLCTSLNMKQLITQPTRVTETSKSLIDIIFTSNPAIIVDSGIVETPPQGRVFAPFWSENGYRNRANYGIV